VIGGGLGRKWHALADHLSAASLVASGCRKKPRLLPILHAYIEHGRSERGLHTHSCAFWRTQMWQKAAGTRCGGGYTGEDSSRRRQKRPFLEWDHKCRAACQNGSDTWISIGVQDIRSHWRPRSQWHGMAGGQCSMGEQHAYRSEKVLTAPTQRVQSSVVAPASGLTWGRDRRMARL
jgi:hypothetical protein